MAEPELPDDLPGASEADVEVMRRELFTEWYDGLVAQQEWSDTPWLTGPVDDPRSRNSTAAVRAHEGEDDMRLITVIFVHPPNRIVNLDVVNGVRVGMWQQELLYWDSVNLALPGDPHLAGADPWVAEDLASRLTFNPIPRDAQEITDERTPQTHANNVWDWLARGYRSVTEPEPSGSVR